MKGLLTITLGELRFFGYHGLYPEEKLTGNEFLVDLEVCFEPEQGTIGSISDTINYGSVYELVKKQMSVPTGLLETLAMDMANSIHQQFPQTKRICIQVRKMHPPLAFFEGNVGVKYERNY